MAAVKRFRAKPVYLNSQQLHPNGRWTSDMRLKRLQTAAMVVMVIFYPDKFLYEFYWEKDIRAILVFWDFLKKSTPLYTPISILGGATY